MPMVETRNCRACKAEFRIEPDDFSFYEKMDASLPVLCPECRFKWRAQFRNEMSLYTRKCDLCSDSMVTMYSPDSPYTVYCYDCYISDKWDPYAYALDHDPDKPFFDQLQDLLLKVPKKNLYITSGIGPNINSPYTNMAGANKDCYLVFNSGQCEESMYCRGLKGSKGVLDGYLGTELENSYEFVNAQKSSGVMYAHNVVGCVNTIFAKDLSGCTDCFGCVNLRHKSYHFLNEPLSKEEYEKKVAAIMGSYSEIEKFKKQFYEFSLKFPRRQNSNIKTSDCVGDYIFESKSLYNCFEVTNSEDVRHAFSVKFVKDSQGLIGYGYNSELLLECTSVGAASRIIGSYAVDAAENIGYSFELGKNSRDCFGCDGLRSAENCILNKKYSKEEYERVRAGIVEELKASGEYGLFMPPKLAPFGYNETVANDNMPLSKEEALAQGFKWQDKLQITAGEETVNAEDLPDLIKDVEDSITQETLACVSCHRNYRIVSQELQFYRRMTLPLPRKCFYCRHKDRLAIRGPFKIFDRQCDNCKKQITSTYAPDRPEIVYCEQCYQREVI